MIKPRWPRGKYNGMKIEGFYISFKVHVFWWAWKPLFKWNFGEPFFQWLCFSFRARAEYHHEVKQFKSQGGGA